jgi:hypothetical protein
VHILCLPHLPLPDQEVDDFAVAQSTPLPECIAGFEGDAVRSPPFSIAVLSLSSPKPSPLYTCKPTPSPCVQGGETYAEGFGISILIPKNFRHESFEAEETAKELTIQAAKELTIKAAKAKAAKAKGEAKDEANKAETKAKKSAALQQASAKQKIKKRAATEKAAAAPTKEDAAVKRSCTVSFPGARVVLVIAALCFAAAMALPGANSSVSAAGAAEVVTTKSIFSSANDQQCGLYDNDDSCAVQEAFETTCSVRLSRHLNPHPYT